MIYEKHCKKFASVSSVINSIFICITIIYIAKMFFMHCFLNTEKILCCGIPCTVELILYNTCQQLIDISIKIHLIMCSVQYVI